MEKSKELIYGLNDRPPLRETLFAALQHLLAIFVAIITPPLIISSALKFDLETTGVLLLLITRNQRKQDENKQKKSRGRKM